MRFHPPRALAVLLALAAVGIAMADAAPTFLPFRPDALQPAATADAELRAAAGWLRADPGRRVVIAGEVRRESPEYALALGQRRAEVVAQRLRALGAAGVQMDTMSQGRTGRDGVVLRRLEAQPLSPERP